MKGILYLSIRHLLHNFWRSLILILCVAVSIFLPAATKLLVEGYDRTLRSRAAQTPLMAGAKGNRFDLTFAALYFRKNALDPIPYGQVAEIQRDGLGVAIPIGVRFTARERPIVATSPEYYERRGLKVAAGSLPLQLGDVVLGANVARELGLGEDDALFSDPSDLYDISKPPALKMRVSGVLSAAKNADDDAVFVDTKTSWVLEGFAHGHDEVEEGSLDENMVIARTENNVAVSGAMIEYNEITPENIQSFHFHGDPSGLPLTAVLVFPRNTKSRTLLKARTNVTKLYQMVVPSEVVDDLMAFVFRIKGFLDAYSLVLAASTALMVLLVILLSMRLRAKEMETLNRIGSSRFTVAKLYATEIAILLGLSVFLAMAGLFLVRNFLPQLLEAMNRLVA